MIAPRHRIFFAIQPKAGRAQEIHRFAHEMRRCGGLAGQPTEPERLHVSLNFVATLARLDRQVIDRAMAVGAAVVMPSFMFALNWVGSWGRGAGPKAVVLRGGEGVIGATLLHEQLHQALAQAGLTRRADPGIEPHMTLLRDKAEVAPRSIAPVIWRVEDFVLLDSVQGEGRHEVLGRWRLGG